jgi:two-component system, cell cycle response regulator
LKTEELEKIIQQVLNFDHMYQLIRVIDPINKTVVFERDKDELVLNEKFETCYNLWNKNKVCNNCISMRAYNENDVCIKIETTDDKIIMATAIPIKVDEGTLVVELIKDVTRSMILDDSKLSKSSELVKLLEMASLASVTDELTKTYNKRYIQEKLPVELVVSKLNKDPLTIIMTDIDHFKRINDTYGHLAGDEVLRGFCRILKGNLREDIDWIARFGGEEFLICLTQTNHQTALKVAERLRKSIEDADFVYKEQNIKITASFGLCTNNAENDYDIEKFVHCVDRNLYQAKDSGRNMVIG